VKDEGKSKVKVFLYLNKDHSKKVYGRSTGVAPCILNLDTRWK
jgi:hypothetical protein